MMELRASSLGSCVKALVAEQLGYKPVAPPAVMQARFDAGNDHETECLAAMRADGWVIDSEQLEIIVPSDIARITGHLDGIVHEENRDRVLEIKSPNAWGQFEKAVRGGPGTPLTNKYLMQISCYMHATGLEALVCCVEDGRVKTFGVELSPISLDQIQERVAYIDHWVKLNRGETERDARFGSTS